jgi:methionine synthase I (cobalamin-dependent)
MLHARGLPVGEPPERWNLTRPEVVLGVHEAYLAVGCDVVTTNTFGANRLRLAEHRLEGQMGEINARAVELARNARSLGHLVAASVGPTGRFCQGRREGTAAEVRSAFAEQIAHLVRASVDLILIETMTHLTEAQMALQAAQESPPVPVGVSLVFFEQRGELLTHDGASPSEAVRALGAAEIVGCNCVEIEVAVDVVRQMWTATALPLIAQPHAGLPGKPGEPGSYPRTPDAMARHLPSLLPWGLGILGGCCGTSPAHLEAFIRAARQG